MCGRKIKLVQHNSSKQYGTSYYMHGYHSSTAVAAIPCIGVGEVEGMFWVCFGDQGNARR